MDLDEEYFYNDGENPCGPFTLTELISKVNAKAIPKEILVSTNGIDNWLPFCQIVGQSMFHNPSRSKSEWGKLQIIMLAIIGALLFAAGTGVYYGFFHRPDYEKEYISLLIQANSAANKALNSWEAVREMEYMATNMQAGRYPDMQVDAYLQKIDDIQRRAKRVKPAMEEMFEKLSALKSSGEEMIQANPALLDLHMSLTATTELGVIVSWGSEGAVDYITSKKLLLTSMMNELNVDQ